MACRVDVSESELLEQDKKNKKKVQKRISFYKKEADLVTRLLCAASKLLKKKQVEKMPKEYADWKKKHDAWDKKRMESEAKEKQKKKDLEKKEKKAKFLKAKKALAKAKKDLVKYS